LSQSKGSIRRIMNCWPVI